MLCLCGFELYSRWVPLIVTETTQLSLIYETFFDDTSAVISVAYFCVKLKSRKMFYKVRYIAF